MSLLRLLSRSPLLIFCLLLPLSACAQLPQHPIPASTAPTPAEANPGQAELVRQVAAATGKAPAELEALLAGATVQQSILDAIARPAEGKPWREYRPIFLSPQRIDAGIDFYRQHQPLIERFARQYGVPAPMLVAIIGVETYYGRISGRYRVLDALVTLGFHYPPRQAFFRSQLQALLELPANRLGGPLPELVGSYAGAQGLGQFMPSSIRDYAVDGDDDGRIDLNHSLADVFASVANYFVLHGWESGAPVMVRAHASSAVSTAPPAWTSELPTTPVATWAGQGYVPSVPQDPARAASLLTLEGSDGNEYWLTFRNFQVITRYNRSPLYATAVTQLAAAISQGVASDAPAP